MLTLRVLATCYEGTVYTHDELLQLLEYFPQMICWKGVDAGHFIGCNKKFSDFVGLKSTEEVYGKTGLDFFTPEAVKIILEHEKRVIEEKKPLTVNDELYDQRTGLTTIDLTIAPIFDAGNNIVSIFYYGTPIIILSNKPWKEALKFINKDNMPKILRSSKYFANGKFGKIKLTKREAECSLYLIKGLTSKEMSEAMGLSPGTIYNYIDNVKLKFNCTKKSELLSLLMASDFIDNF